jgi:hypothetical protein
MLKLEGLSCFDVYIESTVLIPFEIDGIAFEANAPCIVRDIAVADMDLYGVEIQGLGELVYFASDELSRFE